MAHELIETLPVYADGYAIFGAITALQAVQAVGAPHPRCVILIEGGEESDVDDLPFYIRRLHSRIGISCLTLTLASLLDTCVE